MRSSKSAHVVSTFALQLAGILLGAAFACPGVERVLYLSLSGYCLGLLGYLCCSDPGLLGKQNEDYKRKVKFAAISYEVLEHEGSIIGRTFSGGSSQYNEKFCISCGIFYPTHATHCRDCQRCVAGIDHHCPWLGNCVGENNYQEFMSLLTAEAVRGLVGFFFRVRYGVQTFSLSLGSLGSYATVLMAAVQLFLGLGLWAYFVLLFLWGTTARAFWKRRLGGNGVMPQRDKKFLAHGVILPQATEH